MAIVYSGHNVNVQIVFFYLSRSGNSLVRVGLASYYKLTEFLIIGIGGNLSNNHNFHHSGKIIVISDQSATKSMFIFSIANSCL